MGSKPKAALLLEEKQAAAACGQIELFSAWRDAFAPHKLKTAQLLLTAEDSIERRRYLNARNTIETLLELGAIPVINENDTVATAEIRFGDNDRLAARVAQMAGADLLILFSDIDGLYTADPTEHPEAKFIAEVKEITPGIEQMAGTSSSDIGSGGMITKLEAGKIALSAGCHMVIAHGKELHPLAAIFKAAANTRISWPQESRCQRASTGSPLASTPPGASPIDEGLATALKSGKSVRFPPASKPSTARSNAAMPSSSEAAKVKRSAKV